MKMFTLSIQNNKCSYGINVGLKWKTAFIIWNGEFAQGDFQYNNKMVLKIYLILENTSRFEWMDVV
jgi:hypothetical protein